MSRPRRKLPSVRVLRRLLRLDEETGKLYWRERPAWMFRTRRAWNGWNARYKSAEAFTTKNSSGYKKGAVLGVVLQAHRVVYAIHQGGWPKENIDHINGLHTDNRPANLRDVSHRENMRNKAERVDNRSGANGVGWSESKKKWVAYITVERRQTHLGYFTSKDEAIAARKAAERKYGFHRNHGRRRRPS